MRKLASAWVALALLGCAPRGEPEATSEAMVSANDLVATMEIEAREDALRLALHVTNPTSAPVELEFATAQRYDFTVTNADGDELWRWSADRMFAQVLGTETLEPGATRRYTAEWMGARGEGELIATGVVTATNRTIRQAARFELAGGE